MIDIDYQVDLYERSLVQWEVSIFDIIQHPLYVQWSDRTEVAEESDVTLTKMTELITSSKNSYLGMPTPPKDVLNKILHELGMDVTMPYSKSNSIHRSFGGNKVLGERFSGMIRKDNQWTEFTESFK